MGRGGKCKDVMRTDTRDLKENGKTAAVKRKQKICSYVQTGGRSHTTGQEYELTHSPMDAAVAHDNMCGSQTSAELGGHGEQADSRSSAGRILTGGSAAAADETLHQAVQLLHSIKGTHQLGGNKVRGVSLTGVRRLWVLC